MQDPRASTRPAGWQRDHDHFVWAVRRRRSNVPPPPLPTRGRGGRCDGGGIDSSGPEDSTAGPSVLPLVAAVGDVPADQSQPPRPPAASGRPTCQEPPRTGRCPELGLPYSSPLARVGRPVPTGGTPSHLWDCAIDSCNDAESQAARPGAALLSGPGSHWFRHRVAGSDNRSAVSTGGVRTQSDAAGSRRPRPAPMQGSADSRRVHPSVTRLFPAGRYNGTSSAAASSAPSVSRSEWELHDAGTSAYHLSGDCLSL